jgi:hypothetical protein
MGCASVFLGAKPPDPSRGASPPDPHLGAGQLGARSVVHWCRQHAVVVGGVGGPQPIRYPRRVLFQRSRSDLRAVEGNQGRHRTEMQEQVEQLPDDELESYLAALSPESEAETTGPGRRFAAAEVYQLRLPAMANEQLRELAAQRNTSPMALAQEWVLQRLEWEAQQLHHHRR